MTGSNVFVVRQAPDCQYLMGNSQFIVENIPHFILHPNRQAAIIAYKLRKYEQNFLLIKLNLIRIRLFSSIIKSQNFIQRVLLVAKQLILCCEKKLD